MFAVTVTFSIRLGQQQQFLDALMTHTRAALETEAGMVRGNILGDPARPGKVTLVQIFSTAEDFDDYRASREAKAFDAEVVDIVTTRAIATWSQVIDLKRPD